MSEPAYTDSGAEFDPDRRYRYRLWRMWDERLPRVAFVMLNPSTADERVLDPTLRRCLGYARSWGFGAFEVGNLFALRSTSPARLYDAQDPVGPDNDRALQAMAARCALLVCGWGVHGTYLSRDAAVMSLLGTGKPLYCLRETRHGQPSHPLYLPGDLRPELLRSAPAPRHQRVARLAAHHSRRSSSS